MTRKRLFTLIIEIIIIFIISRLFFEYQNIKYTPVPKAFYKVEIGMTKKEVIDLIQSPVSISYNEIAPDIYTERWFCYYKSIYPSPPVIIFNDENKVVGIRCDSYDGENYKKYDEDFYKKIK